MKQHGRGTIVNVSSIAAEYPMPYMSLYNATKAGLSAFSRSLMLETHQIVIIDLQPGDFHTPFKIEYNIDTMGDQAKKTHRVMQQHIESYPGTAIAAKQLKKILKKNTSGTYRIRSFSQARLYPLLLKQLPQHLIRFILKCYYKIK